MQYKSCPMIDGCYLQINGHIETDAPVLSLCCESVPNPPAVPFANMAEASLERFLGMRQMLVAESVRKNGATRWGCAGCVHYCEGEHNPDILINYVNLSMYPAPCQCRCCYCGDKKYENTPAVRAAYEKMFDMLDLAQSRGLIASDAIWQISSGEITIHPYKKRVMELVHGKRATFYTNTFLFDRDIAQNLHDNPGSAINLSIDAGTPETWHKVKGVDNFETVTSNLVQYYKSSVCPGQIQLKYIILPGMNDTYEDYRSLMEIMKVLEVSHLSISRDVRHKYTINSEEHIQLIGAAAYLAAFCGKNNISVDMFNYSQEEIEETKRLGSEILTKGLN